MIELFILVLTYPLILLGVHFYSKYFMQDTAPHRQFEAWCASRPLLAGLACTPGQAAQVAAALDTALGPTRQVFTHQGRHPWPSYCLSLSVEAAQDVVLVRVERARLKRRRDERPEAFAVLQQVAAKHAPVIDTVWLHGGLYNDARVGTAFRQRVGWTGRVGQHGDLSLSNMIGLPSWL